MSIYLTRDEKPINAAAYRCNRYINMRSLLPSTCANVIRTTVVSSSLMFRTEAGVNLPMSLRFHRYVNTYWSAFIRDCIDEILTIGILAVTYEVVRDKVDGTVLITPYVVKGELGIKYDITVGLDNSRLGQLRYRFYRLIDEHGNACRPRYDPDVHIFHGFGYDPLSDGRLRSVVSSIVWQERYISKMYFYALRIEQTRSSGTVYIESSQSMAQPTNGDTYFADGDQTTRQDEMYYHRTEREMEETERARQLASVSIMSELIELNINTDDVRDGVDLFEAVGANTKVPIIPIPDGRRIARPSEPSSIQNWADINRIYQDNVCTRYGVPRDMLFSEAHRATKDHSNVTLSTFEKNISGWKRALEQVLECVYNDLFGDDDADFMFADTIIQTIQHRKRELEPTDNDPASAAANNNTPSAVKTNNSYFMTQAVTTTIPAITTKKRSPIGSNNHDHSMISQAMAADDARSQLMNFRKTLRSSVRKSGDVSDENIEDTVDRLSRMALPVLIKEINQLPDSIDTEDSLFTVYADRLLDVVRERVRVNRVRISYVSIPNTNVQDLWDLYLRCIMPWNEYEQAVRAANNLPVHLEGTLEPWSFEQKAVMLGMMVETTVNPPNTASNSKSKSKSKSKSQKKPNDSGSGGDDDDDDAKKVDNKSASKNKRKRSDSDNEDKENATTKTPKRDEHKSKSSKTPSKPSLKKT